MARYAYERLTAQDNSFLIMESPKHHMHVASTLIYDAGPLRTKEGGIDFERVKAATEGYLHRIPRYRQKLHFIPLEGSAVWVDDRHFSLDYHVRHAALPKPGSDEQLRRLASRIMAMPLDRARPLWETWIVEGLEGDRFAVITKIHHCMIDGSSGVDVAQIMMRATPDRDIPQAPAFMPRPAPSNTELLRAELWHRATLPLEAVRNFRAFAAETDDLRRELAARAGILASTLGMGTKGDETPMNGVNGPHRRFDWLNTSLEDLKAVRRALSATINDVVLTIVTGAVREYLTLRGIDPASLEFRISAPVSVRSEEERGRLGNRVSSWILALPIDQADPRAQLERIHETTQDLKGTNQALGVEMMMQVAEWTPSILLSLGAQAINGPINTIVTNVPGPQFPLYLQGAELEAIYPQVPLLPGLGIGIALMSYNGRVCWGFNSDPDIVPDGTEFAKLVAKSFRRVAEAAGVELSEKPKAGASAPASRKKAKKAKDEAAALGNGSGEHVVLA
ncbi:MAG: wax ester/triacylglycerol synthase family O-acyltransferase [Myxococcota bacterium]|nr:wax ester/triacylglycerol synthase family O-acyltransferase [Myxococcales bacterium]